MGLNHPRDYQAWVAWERSRHRARNLKSAVVGRVRPAPPAPPLVLTSATDEPVLVAALDVSRGTSVDALVRPMRGVEGGAVLSRGDLPAGLVPEGWTSRALADADELPGSVRAVLSAGSFPHVSLPAHAVARRRGVPFVVVQHGLLTPFAPPLPEDSLLVAWTGADADFWTEGRRDVRTAVAGSYLLWKASRTQATAPRDGEPPAWLGQLHGAELPTREVAAVAYRFCRDTGAAYRAHPGERDIRSRAYHWVWGKRGIAFEVSGLPLAELGRPVAAMFSTGLLEASVQGLPAWGYHSNPPAWLTEFWDRYGIGRWGGEPTAPFDVGIHDPSADVAAIALGGAA